MNNNASESLVSAQENTLHPCPNCGHSEYNSTGDSLDLPAILKRWEDEASITFREIVWEQYALPTPQSVSLYECAQCGFKRFEPIVVGTPEFYTDITSGKTSYYVNEKWEFLRAIDDLKRAHSQSVLDIGCGSGEFLGLIRDRAPEVKHAIGYEFSAEVAESARVKGHQVYSGVFPDSLESVNPEGFDAITGFQVLEHAADPFELLRQARRLLKEDGLLIIGVPNSKGPIRHFNHALTEIPPHHVTRWCVSAFEFGMARLGLQVVSAAYEPLPNYLWDWYLPVMMEHDFALGRVGRYLNRKGVTRRLVQVLRALKLKRLYSVTGHTIYVVMQRKSLENSE